MLTFESCLPWSCAALLGFTAAAFAQNPSNPPAAENRSAAQASAPKPLLERVPATRQPALPEGLTLDETLDRANSPPPKGFPNPVFDDQAYSFTLFDQLEERISTGSSPNHLGWDAQGWVGYDLNKLWWKSEGEAVFEGDLEGEAEHELLYARLIAPFWHVQIGAGYSQEWSPEPYRDTWMGVIGLEGLAPFKFELAPSLYFSERGDVSANLEAEYDLRVTQRLVLQPRTELTLFAQDVPAQDAGAGLSDFALGLRLRYEFRRRLAPYLGLRYRLFVGETAGRVEAAGAEAERLFFVFGVRFAF